MDVMFDLKSKRSWGNVKFDLKDKSPERKLGLI